MTIKETIKKQRRNTTLFVLAAWVLSIVTGS